MKKITKKMTAIGLGALAIGAGAGALGMHSTYEPQIITKEVPVIVENKTVETVEVPVEKIVEKNVTVTKEVIPEVYTDLLEVLELEDGNVSYLTEDLDDDEVELIVERLVFIQDIKSLAVQEVEKELFDELDKEVVNGTELDEDDMSRLDIDEDFEDLIVSDIDYDYEDAVITVTGDFEHDDVKYIFEAEVEFEDGEVTDLDVTSVSEK